MSTFGSPASPTYARDNTIVIVGLAFFSIFASVALVNASMIYDYFNSRLGFLELVGSILLLINVYLLAEQKLVNYWFGLAGVLVFGYIFKEVNLLSDMYLQWAFYAPLQIIGFVIWMWGPTIWDWGRNLFAKVIGSPWMVPLSPVDSMKIKTMTPFLYAITAVALSVALMLWIPHMRAAGAAFAVADSIIMWLSIAASILMLRKYLENWLLWITVDVIAIPVYYQKGLVVTSGLYVIFLCLATYGLWTWWTEYRAEKAAINETIRKRWETA